MMTWYDYLIVIIPLCFVYGMALYTRRYIRGVVDFLSTGRLCGRYVMSVAGVASGLSIIGVVAFVEVHYKTGFALGFWQSILLPLSVIMGLTGFFNYRFRETKAMSLGQFLDLFSNPDLGVIGAGQLGVAGVALGLVAVVAVVAVVAIVAAGAVVVTGRCAGSQREHQAQSQQQCDDFLHFVVLLNICCRDRRFFSFAR